MFIKYYTIFTKTCQYILFNCLKYMGVMLTFDIFRAKIQVNFTKKGEYNEKFD